MRIGIDVDGVLVDMEAYQLKYGTEYFVNHRKMAIQNPKGYDIMDIFGCTKKEREAFWLKYIWGYCLCEPMTENAAKTIAKLRDKGHEIYVITGRAHTTEKGITGWLFRKMLKNWLKRNDFVYDEIIFCSESDSSTDKVDICKKYQIDVMIDDKAENLLNLMEKTNTKVLCYPAVWNADVKALDPYRINDFLNIEKYFKSNQE